MKDKSLHFRSQIPSVHFIRTRDTQSCTCDAACVLLRVGAQAQLKVEARGWQGVVHVVEADACTFVPPAPATAVTFSYSLSSETLFPPSLTGPWGK